MYTTFKFFVNVLFQKDKSFLLVSFVKKLSKRPQNRVHPTPYKKKKEVYTSVCKRAQNVIKHIKSPN